MDEEEVNTKGRTILIVAGVIVFGAMVKYGVSAYGNHKREKALEEYVERIGCLEAAKRRLLRIARDPDRTHDDFLDAVKEEKKFLNIVSEPLD